MKQFLSGLSKDWYEAYYTRMLNHCRRRFQVMGATGKFWQDVSDDMEELRRRLQYAVDQNIIKKEHLDDDQRIRLKLFLDGPQAVYGSYAAAYFWAVENICVMWETIKDKNTIIFGSGKAGKFLHALIAHKYEGNVQCYCDNQERLWGVVQGIPVISPEEAVKRYPEAIYLIPSVRFETEMRAQLTRLGIAEKNIFTYNAGTSDLLVFQM